MSEGSVRLLGAKEVSRVLPMRECVEALALAFAESAHAPVRSFVGGVAAAEGKFHIKAALREGERALFVAKTNANFPGNPARGLPTIQGVLALFDAENGRLLALMDSGSITAIRTAAATAVAAKFLAPADARSLAIVGCGTQALQHVRAIREVRGITEVRALDLDRAAAEKLARVVKDECGIDAEAFDDLRAATGDADIVVTLTSSRRAFLRRDDVRAGAFVAGVGADSPDKSELDPALLAGARIIVDDLDQCAEMGDLHHAIAAGRLAKSDVAGTLAGVAADPARYPAVADRVTVFDSTGIPMEDVVAARLAFDRAEKSNIGSAVSLG